MAANITSSNIKVYQKKKHLNIGIAIFWGYIYLSSCDGSDVSDRKAHFCLEVREGSIVKDSFLHRSSHS